MTKRATKSKKKTPAKRKKPTSLRAVLEKKTARVTVKQVGKVRKYERTKKKPYRSNTAHITLAANLNRESLDKGLAKYKSRGKKGPTAALVVTYGKGKNKKTIGTPKVRAGENTDKLLDDVYKVLHRYNVALGEVITVRVNVSMSIRSYKARQNAKKSAKKPAKKKASKRDKPRKRKSANKQSVRGNGHRKSKKR